MRKFAVTICVVAFATGAFSSETISGTSSSSAVSSFMTRDSHGNTSVNELAASKVTTNILVMTGTLSPGSLPIANINTIGAVKPDGTSVTIDPDGTLHSANVTGKVNKSGDSMSGTLSFTGDAVQVSLKSSTADEQDANIAKLILQNSAGNANVFSVGSQGDVVAKSVTTALINSSTAQLELRVGGNSALRLIAATDPATDAPGIVGGFSGNNIKAGVKGGTVVGGGNTFGPNRVTDDYGFVGGGIGNRAGNDSDATDDAYYATVGGGLSNVAAGPYSTIGGGNSNAVGDSIGYATISGGQGNTANGPYSTIAGGNGNTTSGANSIVAGGSQNRAAGDYSFAAGTGARINAAHTGATLFSDFSSDAQNQVFNFNSAAANEFATRSTGGVRFVTAINGTTGAPTKTFTIAASGNVTAAGVIESQAGGFKFPDGTTQTTAGGSSGWSLTGNAGTVDGTNFMGTTDNVALTLRVNNVQALRIDPAAAPATDAPNIVGGFSGNSVGGALYGATISGGGQIGLINAVVDVYGTIGGGYGNHAGNSATVAGGNGNWAVGFISTISGGTGNVASGDFSTVAGGNASSASGFNSTIPGGSRNMAASAFSFAAGRNAKVASAHTGAALFSDSSSFDFNSAAANEFATRSTGGIRFVTAIDGTGAPTKTFSIAAMTGNVSAAGIVESKSGGFKFPDGTTQTTAGGSSGWSLTGNAGTVDGTNFLGTTDNVALTLRANNVQALRIIPAAAPATDAPSVVGGFSGNRVDNGVKGATISGGGKNGGANVVSGDYGTVGGGSGNTSSGPGHTVSGGSGNSATGGGFGNSTIGGGGGNTANGNYETIAGGNGNTVTGYYSAIGGGLSNLAASSNSTISGGTSNRVFGTSSTVGGGNSNSASGANSTVSGGAFNAANGDYSTIPGGISNLAEGSNSFAAGKQAHVLMAHAGASLFSDSSAFDFNSAAANEFAARSTGGVRFVTAIDGTGAPTKTFSIAATTGNVSAAGSVTASSFIGNLTGNASTATNATNLVAQLAAVSTINNASNPVDWTELKNVPASIATGNIGTVTSIMAGTNLSGGTITTSGIISVVDNPTFTTSVTTPLVTAPIVNSSATSGLNIQLGGNNVFRLIPAAVPGTDAPSIIGGFSGNSIANGVKGATISGGGQNGNANTVSGDYGTIGGGTKNMALGTNSTVGGGFLNNAGSIYSTVAGGVGNSAINQSSTVSGGNGNTASGSFSTIGGGAVNTTLGTRSTVGGGAGNTASGSYSTISGGDSNTAAGDYSFAAGRSANVGATHTGTVLFSDSNGFNFNSAASNEFATRSTGGVRFVTAIDGTGAPTKTFSIAGTTGDVSAAGIVESKSGGFKFPDGSTQTTAGTGTNFTAGTNIAISAGAISTVTNPSFSMSVTTPMLNSTGASLNIQLAGNNALRLIPAAVPGTDSPSIIGGFSGNSITLNVKGATISGGGQSGNVNTVTSDYGTVSGGIGNKANNTYSTVGGGQNNFANGQTSTVSGGTHNAAGDTATVGGGALNVANGSISTIGGGYNNSASGSYSTVGGGQYNSAGNSFSTVGGGQYNSAGNSYSTVGGGYSNYASGSFSTVGGGDSNFASGLRSSVAGGLGNIAASDYSFAAGSNAFVNVAHPGTALISDSYGFIFNSAAANEFATRSTGGVRFVTAIDGTGAPTKTFSIAGTTGDVSAPGRVTASTLTMITGAGSGKVLVSDANGNATWVTLAGTTLKAPTVQKFTATGAGTYTTPAGVLYIKVTMVGAGGGGGGGGASGDQGNGGGGNATTFGTSLLVANGGGGGARGNTGGDNPAGGAGGTASLGTGPNGIALQGGSGSGGENMVVSNYAHGGSGASGPWGGQGGSNGTGFGNAGSANSGSGGGGGGATTGPSQSGAGGGAGGFIQAIITSPSATYNYSIGTGGTGGTAGTSFGKAGGAGGSGVILIEEFYQ